MGLAGKTVVLTGASRKSVRNWEKGHGKPRVGNLKKLSEMRGWRYTIGAHACPP